MLAASAASSPYLKRRPGRRVEHLAALRAARRRIDIPALGRGRHQHGPRGRAGLAQRLPRAADRIRVAGRLHAQQRIGVELFVGRRMLQPHLLEIHLQLFGDQHRDRGVGALAHLDIGHGQDDLPVALDADEGVGREGLGVGRFGFARRERQAQAQHQAAAGGRSGLQERCAGRDLAMPDDGALAAWDASDRGSWSASLSVRLRGLLDRFANADIGAAAADVAGHRIVDVGVGRMRIACEQRRRRHDLARLAVAALRRPRGRARPSGSWRLPASRRSPRSS